MNLAQQSLKIQILHIYAFTYTYINSLINTQKLSHIGLMQTCIFSLVAQLYLSFLSMHLIQRAPYVVSQKM